MELKTINTAKGYVKSTQEVSLAAFKDKMQLNDEETEKLIACLTEEGFLEKKVGFLFRYNKTAKSNRRSPSLEYVKTVGEITYSALEEWTQMDKDDVHELVWEMVNDGLLERGVGFLLHYLGEDSQERSDAVEFQDDEMDDEDEDEDNEDELENIIKGILSDEDDEEKEEDDLDDTEDEDVSNIFEATNFYKRMKVRRLEHIAGALSCKGQFNSEEVAFFYHLGVTYPDDTQVCFKLFDKTRILLSDCGRTYQYMKKYFNMDDKDVQRMISIVIEDYSLEWLEQEDQKELCVKIRDSNSAFCAFLYLYSAIERITTIQEGGLLRGITDDLEAFCKSEIVDMVLQEKLSYEEAKEKAKAMYQKAVEDNSEFEKQIYKNIFTTLNAITEDNYEAFRNSLTDTDDED